MKYHRKARKLIDRVEALIEEKARLLIDLLVENKQSDIRRLLQVNFKLQKLDPNRIIFDGIVIPGDIMRFPLNIQQKKISEKRSLLVKNVAELIKAKKLKPLS